MAEKHNGHDSWKTNIESARGHFDQGLRELAHAAEQAKNQGKEALDNARERAREAWEEARQKSVATWDATQQKRDEILAETEKYVRRSPVKALAAAAFVGMVFGLLFSRRDD